MAKKLKAVIFGISNVIARVGEVEQELFSEIGRLIKYLQLKGITPVFFGNHDWTITDNGKVRRLQDYITIEWGEFPWFIAFKDDTPAKGTAAASEHILNHLGLDNTEVVYVGNTDKDMQTAVNGKLLFLNVTWYEKNTDYGFYFDSVRDIARFIDIFCLRDSLWHFQIEQPKLRFYALSPYSTFIPQFEYLSNDMKNAMKFGHGNVDFWTKYLFSTIYFSELYKEINYIAVIPGHEEGSGNTIMAEPMSIFAKCFRQRFLSDFIIRHTTIEASHVMRRNRQQPNHKRQLDSISLNENPMFVPGRPYKKCPVTAGKTVLVIDDICSSGYSLEAARLFIEQTGARVICMAWLKTINLPYEQIVTRFDAFSPFGQYTFPSDLQILRNPYQTHITDKTAPEEITQKLLAYENWTWPDNL